jgi:cell division protein FtsW (lipid II flippase)
VNKPTIYELKMIYTRIKPEYVAWWGVSASTYFRVMGRSLSGASRWIEMNGERKSVPAAVLTYPGH